MQKLHDIGLAIIAKKLQTCKLHVSEVYCPLDVALNFTHSCCVVLS
jgi:hypothetical protein